MITMDDITAAQSNDMGAITRVCGHVEQTVLNLARNIHAKGSSVEIDDLAQEGRLAVWQALPRFTADTVDAFTGFAYRTALTAMRGHAQADRFSGVSQFTADVYAAMVKKSNGDHEVARELSQTLPPKGQRLSRNAAWAAYSAFNTEPAFILNESGGSEQALDRLSQTHGVPDDLVTAEDKTRDARSERGTIVRAVLDSMTDLMNEVLRGTYGIERPEIADIDELADALGLDREAVRRARSKGHTSFAKRYIGVVATSEAHAAQLTADAAAARKRS